MHAGPSIPEGASPRQEGVQEHHSGASWVTSPHLKTRRRRQRGDDRATRSPRDVTPDDDEGEAGSEHRVGSTSGVPEDAAAHGNAEAPASEETTDKTTKGTTEETTEEATEEAAEEAVEEATDKAAAEAAWRNHVAAFKGSLGHGVQPEQARVRPSLSLPMSCIPAH